jgi:hypothetical protein
MTTISIRSRPARAMDIRYLAMRQVPVSLKRTRIVFLHLATSNTSRSVLLDAESLVNSLCGPQLYLEHCAEFHCV